MSQNYEPIRPFPLLQRGITVGVQANNELLVGIATEMASSLSSVAENNNCLTQFPVVNSVAL